MNQAESEALACRFKELGCTITAGDSADVFVINTCSVTHIADRKSRHLVRMLRKLNPLALIAVTGCYAEWDADSLKECGADVVVGNAGKASVPELIERRIKAITPAKRKVDLPGRVRSFIKIQDGCRNFCAYCIVPLLRRDVYGVPPEVVIGEVNSKASRGCKEVVLTGTEIGSYNCGGLGLTGLLERVLNETAIDRLHLTSLQPQEIDGELLGLWQSPRLVRHFHLALQSGSDSVLRRMRRRYDTDKYAGAVGLIRSLAPDASITADVMAGFPGETDEEFWESYNFCERMHFSAMHIFAYSPRPGTKAAGMPGKVDEKAKKERSLRMLDLAARSADEYARRFIGQTRPVLWENEVKDGSCIYQGLTDNYLRVYSLGKDEIANKILNARLTALATSIANRALRSCTRGNSGELWSELDEDQYQGHAALNAGRSSQAGR